jgi:tetratricopeptide (TPR) repeat protein
LEGRLVAGVGLKLWRWLLVVVMLSAATAAHAQQPAQGGSSAARPASAVVADDYDALFKAMFKDPSNLDLSFRFAEQAVARGDYEAAIGALERMLFYNSNLPRVKLELGVLYFKLGSYDLAKGYFEDAVRGSDVPPEVKAQVAVYLTEINRRLSPYEYALFLQSGVRYQTNANVGPDSTLVRAFGQDAQLNNQFGHAPDWNWFQIAALNFSYKLGRRGDAIELTLLGYYSGQFKFHQYNLGLVEATIGPRVYLTPTVSIKPYAVGDLVWLGDQRYFDASGGGGSIRSPIGEHVLVEAYAETRHRTFYDSSNFPTSSQQTGNLSTVAVLTELRYGFFHLTTRGSYDVNRAIFDYNSYDRWSLDVGLPFEFNVALAGMSHQIVFTPTGGISYTPYRQPNPLVDPFTNRLDRETRVGGILDVQIYQNFGIRTQITQTWINSTLPNFTMRNFTVAFGPTARF